MEKFAVMLPDVPTNMEEGQRRWIEFIFGPWFFANYIPTTTGGDPEHFSAIYMEALAAAGGIFSEADISISINNAKVEANRTVSVTMTINGEMFEWDTMNTYNTAHRLYVLLTQTIDDYMEESIQVLIANAQELFETGYAMMNDVYGYGE